MLQPGTVLTTPTGEQRVVVEVEPAHEFLGRGGGQAQADSALRRMAPADPYGDAASRARVERMTTRRLEARR